jgi:amidase
LTSRREFLERSSAAALTAHLRDVPAGAPQSFELEEWSIAQLQDAMRSGQLTSQRITQMYLARIGTMDELGPTLRHVIEVNPDAGAVAAAMDRERQAGRVRGPLHGVPVIVKDNIDTLDRMHTSAGSLALAQSIAPRDAGLVERLRAAGAVVLAKSNLSEWANIRASRSSSGWSARGGQGRNPYALDRTPCGSSSGTGGAIAASYAAVGVGTETDGSIVCPSSASSLVGIKPTLGLVSRSGIIPIAHSQDTAGPMARSVSDAAILLGAMTGEDPRDPATRQSRGQAFTDYTSFLDPAGLRGARIGVARAKVTGYSSHTDALYEDAVRALAGAGAEVIDPADIPHMGDYDDTELTVLLYELKNDLNAYLATLDPSVGVRTLAQLIDFNEANRLVEMPWFGQDLFIAAQAKGPLTERGYREALAQNLQLARADGIDEVMDRYRLDAVIAPTSGPPWPVDLLNGDHFMGGSSTPAAVSGYPTITVPMGYVNELPVGLTLIGRAWSEPVLIKLAYAYEQTTRHRRAPKYLATAPFPGYTV